MSVLYFAYCNFGQVRNNKIIIREVNNQNINKRKIFNDPIYGFVSIPYDIVFDLIEHPFFQRLRRIKQLGMTHLVYPGALHTRFHHALGAMHLMTKAIEVLRSKGHTITHDEAQGVVIAILLHDIGHGPFSHALEHSLVHGISHEKISDAFMDKLNKLFHNKLGLAIKIFRNKYPKHFLHQMVSSQLDMDRLDYLRRDSFYTGVSEGVISTDRIITMLNVKNDELVVEEKGIYSIEKFIIARRLMYWQVYLHKTVLSAENLIINILKRAKQLAQNKQELFCTPALKHFLYNHIDKEKFFSQPVHLEIFSLLDDYDIFTSIKVWVNHEDKILRTLCNNLINRKLYKIELSNKPFSKSDINKHKQKVCKQLKLKNDEINYFVFNSEIINNAYNPTHDSIKLLNKNGSVTDIAAAADQLNISVLSKPVKKYFLCYPKQ